MNLDDLEYRLYSEILGTPTKEEEAAMNIGSDSRPSQTFYQHKRNPGKDWRSSEPLLTGGATIAYDYHTAQEGSVDIAYGYAICADSDYFCKEKGRDTASRRLSNLTEMSGCITLPLKSRLTRSEINDYVTSFMRRLLELLWDQQK